MQNPISTDATRPPTDDALVDIAEYVLDFRVDSDEAKAPLEEKCRRGLETILPPNWCDDLMTLFSGFRTALGNARGRVRHATGSLNSSGRRKGLLRRNR